MIEALYGERELKELDRQGRALRERGTIRLYSSSWWHDAGAPIDWLLSPSRPAERWPLWRGARLYGATSRWGDIKDVWEIGRCSWTGLMLLQRARERAEPKWARWWMRQLEGFEAQHQGTWLGPHFLSGQECALRLIRWVASAAVLCEDEGVSAAHFERFERLAYSHARWILKHIDFARFASPNNHLIAEALALKTCALCFAHWPEAARFEELADRLLCDEILARQFKPDGTYCQASHTYHRFACELLAWWWAIVPGEPQTRALIAEVLRRSAEHLSACMVDASRGLLPNLGAQDGASWHVLTEGADYDDFRPALEVVRCLVTQARSSWFGDHAPSRLATYMLHGAEALKAPAEAPKRDEPTYRSFSYVNLLNRDGWAVSLRVGELWGTASQIDMGHAELWHRGEALACDLGSYRYDPAESFEAFSSLEGHNTLSWSDTRFAVERVGRFALAGALDARSEAHPRRLVSAHRGWPELVRGRSWREVRVIDGARLIVSDSATLRREARGVMRWNLARGERWSRVEVGHWRNEGGEAVRLSVRGGAIVSEQVIPGWRSRRYAEREAIWVLCVELSARAGSFQVRTEFKV